MITFWYSSTDLNQVESSPLFFYIAPSIIDWQSNSPSLKKCHDDSYAACAMGTFLHESQTDRECEGRWMSLACCTSFPVGPGKSIQRLRHDVQHPRRARSALHGDYHIACHIVGAPHEGEARRRRKRGRRGWGREEGPTRDGSGAEWRRTRRMWTLTALQYTQGHGVYKPPQFYLHPSSARITLAAGIKPFIVLWSDARARADLASNPPSHSSLPPARSFFRDVRTLKFRFSLLPYRRC